MAGDVDATLLRLTPECVLSVERSPRTDPDWLSIVRLKRVEGNKYERVEIRVSKLELSRIVEILSR
jgi:hypothetical protein